jgi:ATP-dependent 26S proteasome regulatory subunit
MMLTSKVVRVLSGGFLLFGLFSMPQVGDVASAADEMKGSPCEIPHGQNAMRAEQAEMQGTHMISGEVIRVEDANYFVKDQGGKEVSVQTDQRTEKPEINQGDRISAYVDDQNHAVWIRSNKMTDRRTEHASADCVPN